jgi:serine/threonine-protein phosphatase 2A regulatory subunit B'
MPTSSRRLLMAPKNQQKGPQSAKVIERSNLILKNRKMMSTPRSDISVNAPVPKAILTTYSHGPSVELADLPDLVSVLPNQFNELLRQKLKECCIHCNFSPTSQDSVGCSLKTRYLQEIAEFVGKPRYFQLCEVQTFDGLFEMIKINLIRTLPPIPAIAKSVLLGDDIKDSWIDGAWPHLSLVYDVFQAFLESPQLSPAQHLKRFDSSFLIEFLSLLNSMDGRERESVKKALHTLYLRFNQLRPKLRQVLQQILITFIYEFPYFNGINELLDFYESIVSGFSVPIKAENIQFLFDVLLPLHRSEFLHVFQDNLFACIADYIDKDSTLIVGILRKLIIYWPSSTVKGRLFITEIGQIVESMNEDQFKESAEELFLLLGRLIEGPNFQLSEATICLWKSDIFVTFTAQFATITYPIIVPSIYRCGVNHWHTAIKNLAVSILSICMQTCPEIYDQIMKGISEIEQHQKLRYEAEKGAWFEVAKQAEGFDNSIHIIELPLRIDELFSSPITTAKFENE